jgi:hypothetical protein
VQAELRSAAALLPSPGAGTSAPTAPAGGVIVAGQPSICDAQQGVAPLLAASAATDPVLAVSSAGLHLPILGNVAPAACGQLAWDGQDLYIAQGVLSSSTPSAATGILRVGVDPTTGLLSGNATVIAANSGLGGNQPTALALGPDGALYFGNLKNGDVKRILNPGAGATQVVQSVGKSPNGRPLRAMAFVGNDLYLGASDSLSVIHGATSSLCTGGCNAVAIADGFAGVPHVGLASDGALLYFAVSGSANQVWRYSPSTPTLALVASGGVDASGGNAAGFSFDDAKTNLLALDAGGNLWIGDDPSHVGAPGAGRVWTISAALLATVGGGTPQPSPELLAALRGPWEGLVVNAPTVITFNQDGTFTVAVTAPDGTISADAGTWTLTAPVKPQVVLNPQGHLTLTDAQGLVLLDGDALLVKPDQFALFSSTGALLPVPIVGLLVFTKAAP